MAPGEEAFGAVYRVDDPGAGGRALSAEIEPGDQIRLADVLPQDLRQKRADLSAPLGSDKLGELLTRFFSDDGIVWIMLLQGAAADNRLRAVVGDGDGSLWSPVDLVLALR